MSMVAGRQSGGVNADAKGKGTCPPSFNKTPLEALEDTCQALQLLRAAVSQALAVLLFAPLCVTPSPVRAGRRYIVPMLNGDLEATGLLSAIVTTGSSPEAFQVRPARGTPCGRRTAREGPQRLRSCHQPRLAWPLPDIDTGPYGIHTSALG